MCVNKPGAGLLQITPFYRLPGINLLFHAISTYFISPPARLSDSSTKKRSHTKPMDIVVCREWNFSRSRELSGGVQKTFPLQANGHRRVSRMEFQLFQRAFLGDWASKRYRSRFGRDFRSLVVRVFKIGVLFCHQHVSRPPSNLFETTSGIDIREVGLSETLEVVSRGSSEMASSFPPLLSLQKFWMSKQILCVCVFSSHPFWTSSSLDVPAGVTQEEGHTGFLIHLLSAVRALIFLARRIQPFLPSSTVKSNFVY